MGFWTWLTGNDYGSISENSTPASSVGDPSWRAGEVGAFDVIDATGIDSQAVAHTESRSSLGLPFVQASPWDGWPADWSTPNWEGGLQKLVDTAWVCLDLNSSILASMPVYRLQSGQIQPQSTWMLNPDPEMYTSWHEFASQLFWDYQMGEAFVMPSEFFASGYPRTFRVIPPWLVRVEMDVKRRRYWIGSVEVTDDILHLRYRSRTDLARGMGPLEAVGARQVAAGILQRYVKTLVETGGVPHYWLSTEQQLTANQASDLLDRWVESRTSHLGEPAVLSGGLNLKQAQYMSAKDMALLELSQWNESRIAIALGVPPFLVGLPSGGDSMTYSNASTLFDYHYRASLRTKAQPVMAALSGWALPYGQTAELNADEYVRLPFDQRVLAYKTLADMGAITPDEVRAMERMNGTASTSALTGAGEGAINAQ